MYMYIISAYIASEILTPLLAASNGDLVRTSVRFVNNTCIFSIKNLNSMIFTLKYLQISIDLNFHTQFPCLTNDKWLIFKNQMNYFSCRHFESEALSRSPNQPSMENRIWRFEKFKLVSNGNITNKIPRLDVYRDKELVVTWSNLP